MSIKTLKGSRNKFVNQIAKWVYEWQLQHNCIVEIIYVNTKLNLSDEPSRTIDCSDEMKISDEFQSQIEEDFSLVRYFHYILIFQYIIFSHNFIIFFQTVIPIGTHKTNRDSVYLGKISQKHQK